ncbi:glycosyltransferase family 4 protein [Arthrobacter mobilis]|uniref:Glycosyltransferase family 4 protein n=1 Tax=Arthrobacter mobilis TaxID=2724944 RepID=A0A7X6K5T8_9MICC|nr:glycosyltransferase family 4 protein [Arthrobacter mobilis]NKX54699.1 glycosyltransferase family 4 protein [Arthrobacter mobilis]
MAENPKYIEWRGRFKGHSGLAIEARSFVQCLQHHGFQVREITVPDEGAEPGPEAGRQRPDGPVPAADLSIVHLPWHDRGWENLSGTVVWRAMFETDSVPAAWLDRTAAVDEVWVPSQFNARTFTAAGVPPEKLHVVPEAVEPAWLDTHARPYRGDGPFKFLSVFRWQYRKGWDVLLQAYLAEFSGNDDVELAIRADPFGERMGYDIAGSIESMVKAVRPRNPPRIRLLSRPLPAAELRRLYAGSHAFVLPTRGEAWGRPFMEAMACGLVTIGTGWGGQLDFMDASNSLLVDYELVDVPEEAAAEWPNFQGQRWAEPSAASLRQCLRRAAENGPDLDVLRNKAAATIRQRYSQDKVNGIFLQEVRRILAR